MKPASKELYRKPPFMTAARLTARACPCKYQKEKTWGYNVQKWDGGSVPWREVGNGQSIVEALALSYPYKFVLIRCNGCGADIIREYPST